MTTGMLVIFLIQMAVCPLPILAALGTPGQGFKGMELRYVLTWHAMFYGPPALALSVIGFSIATGNWLLLLLDLGAILLTPLTAILLFKLFDLSAKWRR